MNGMAYTGGGTIYVEDVDTGGVWGIFNGGLSYDKGCYIGQEITARMHYRGLAKKHLRTVNVAEYTAEEIRSSCGDIGLALVR